MLKAYRFRIYPSPAQVARLTAWEAACRFLWNLAHEQRLLGLSRERAERRYYTAFDQINEITGLRADLTWLADVPRDVCNALLVNLDLAWQRCFKKLAREPNFKRKLGEPPGLCAPHPKSFRIRGDRLIFPKIGNLRICMHREIVGTHKTCTLVRDGDQWFASIQCTLEVPDPAPRVEPVVALDRGVINIVADSDGRVEPSPRYYDRSRKRLARAQRTLSRRKKGSRNRDKARARVARLHQKVRRQREQVIQTLSYRYAKSHGTVVLEALNTKGMIRVGGGLARGIADAGWGRLKQCLQYKLGWSGGRLVEVPAAYSSQTCSTCGAVDARSRRGEAFCCTSCGYRDHADLNAAKVLKTRASRSCQLVEASAVLAGLRSRKSKLRVPRRSKSFAL